MWSKGRFFFFFTASEGLCFVVAVCMAVLLFVGIWLRGVSNILLFLISVRVRVGNGKFTVKDLVTLAYAPVNRS